MLSPGDRFEGFLVDAVVGRGGFSVVYRARETSPPGRTVALKVQSEGHDGPDEAARLRREFEFAHSLHHPNVVTVFAAGPGWLAMEFCDGRPVGQLATVHERMAALRQVAGALDYAHSLGVVHCDVKPANILVPETFPSDGALLIDFGNARLAGQEAPPRATQITASLPYAAPELLTGHAAYAATDSYGLACTFVEMITGSPPFTANTQVALADAQLHRAPPQPSRQISWLPRSFDSVLAKAMAKNPEQRYQSCLELAALITRIVGD